MKQNFIPFFLFLFACLAFVEAEGQSLIIKTKDGTEETKRLSDLSGFGFSSGNLILKPQTGTTESYGLSTISKLYFSSVTTSSVSITPDVASSIPSIYPNPVGNVLYIRNIPDGITNVSIYRMDGVLILGTTVSADNKCIQVANLNRGIYLLIVNNQAIKFVKS